MNIVYYSKGNLYINITNRCSANCDFCLRRNRDEYDGSGSLWLPYEPEAQEILDAVYATKWQRAPEIVFCGFGEPTMRIDEMIKVAQALKDEHPGINLRLNTNGHGNMLAGRDITPELEGLFRTVSVSLNFPDKKTYVERCRPMRPNIAYNSVLEFIQCAVEHVPHVIVTVLSFLPPEDIELAKSFAKSLGASFRVRDAV